MVCETGTIDTDGWWIIKALLDDVRKGVRLAIKGPRESLFPSPYSSTPLRNLVARSVQYDPATWQAQLAGARAARASDRGASTLLSDAQPFELGDSASSGNVSTMAARGVSEAHEAECLAHYERHMAECMAYRSAKGGQRFMAACSQRVFQNYQQCRGY
ncbi:hypothetical protein [Paraburkholderia monticola]|uniref:hypothetical protein n=1 Tax=Paraburkholderia monticola TaxID=1399968 RepID=UPI000AE9E78B|nr:hypothetical protein [Paraburkholderia monticola]